jgi:hypothetical protein
MCLAAFAAASAWAPFASGLNVPGVTAISAGFNGTTIPTGSTVWFNAVLKPNGPLPAGDIVVNFTGQTITIGAGASLSLPDSQVTYSTATTAATTSFNATLNRWETTIPRSVAAKSSFLGGYAYVVPSAFKGDFAHYPVTWRGTFASPTSGVYLNWQWAAAVYTTFAANHGALGVKPTDDNQASAYPNADHAGTPENYKSPQPVGGGTGGGAANFTGSYSATAGVTSGSVNAAVVSTAAQISGSGFAGSSTISDAATLSGGSTFPVAGGTITFKVFGPDDASCGNPPVFTKTVIVNGNGTYASGPITPVAPGKYRVIAVYSGDTYDTPITTGCADMNETVTVKADTKPPQCTLFATNNGPPKSIDVMVQDTESGLTTIAHHESNATVAAPNFVGPTSSPLTIRATKTNASQSANFGLTVKDAAGNTTVCDPLLKADKGRPKSIARPAFSRPAGTAGLSLRVDASRLSLGSAITLSGTVPPARAGEIVSILVRPCGFSEPATLATVKTGANGVFRYTVQPTLGATFAVAWNGLTSKSVRVSLEPRVTLTHLLGHRFRADAVTTNPVFLTGTPVLLQKANGKAWKTIGRTVLVKNSAETGVTVVSSGTFNTRSAVGRLRAVTLGAVCYAQGSSAAISP